MDRLLLAILIMSRQTRFVYTLASCSDRVAAYAALKSQFLAFDAA